MQHRGCLTREYICHKPPATWVLLTGACFGAGLDIISAADIRYCSADAYFCVKEVDLAIAADMGVLQRLPGLIGQGSHMSH